MDISMLESAQLPAVLQLARDCHLPVEDLTGRHDDVILLVARRESRIIGSIGLEVFRRDGLLRTLAVAQDCRRQGVGGALCRHLETLAGHMKVVQLYLLTTAAESYFRRHGFSVLPRDHAPSAIQQCTQFRQLCPASAICMMKSIEAPPRA